MTAAIGDVVTPLDLRHDRYAICSRMKSYGGERQSAHHPPQEDLAKLDGRKGHDTVVCAGRQRGPGLVLETIKGICRMRSNPPIIPHPIHRTVCRQLRALFRLIKSDV